MRLGMIFYAPDGDGGGGGAAPAAGGGEAGGDGGGAPAAGGGTGGGEAAAGGSADAGSSADAAPEAPEPWNGEIESLPNEPWWKDVPESARGRVLEGVKTKARTLHRGANKYKTEMETSYSRRAAELDVRGRQLEALEARLQSLIDGGGDPSGALTAQLEEAQAKHEAELNALRREKDEAAQKMEAERADWERKLAEKEAHAGEAMTRAEQLQAERYADMVETALTYVEDKAAHLLKSDASLDHLQRLITSGLYEDMDQVIAVASVRYPAPAPPPAPLEPEKPSPAIAMMSRGGGGSSAMPGAKATRLDELSRRLREAGA